MTEHNLNIILLAQVIKLWELRFSPVEIGSDPEKIEILNAACLVLRPYKDELPPEVLDLYEKVYLRDVWNRC